MKAETMVHDVFIVLLFLLTLSSMQGETLSSDPLQCPDGWLRHRNSCYKIYVTGKRFFQASEFCRSEDSELASVSDVEVLEFLSANLINDESYWIGLRGGEKIWYNNISVVHQSWVDSNDLWRNNDCFKFDGLRVTWGVCHVSRGFICEVSYNDRTQVTSPCEGYFSPQSRSCIFPTRNMDTKLDSENNCKLNNGEFMDINQIYMENMENLFQYDILDDAKSYWTKLLWVHPHLVLPSGGIWRVGELHGVTFKAGGGDCVTAMFNKSNELQLYQTDCSEKRYMVCIRSEVSQLFTKPEPTIPIPTTQDNSHLFSCPTGYNWKEDQSTGFCYWETSYETSRLSWKNARRYCRSYGGDLASFHSTTEEKIGLNFQYGSLVHPYWIGLQLDLDTGNYTWADGTTLDYENWAPGQPNHRDMRLRCVSMEASAKHWVSSLCGILSWFVCKAPKQLNPKVPVLPTVEPLRQCLSKTRSFYFEEYCYHRVNEIYNWHRAEQYCKNIGGRLVSIHNEREIEFLIRLFDASLSQRGNRVWIGLNSLGFDGSFRWTDRSALDFTYWNENEPNNFQNQEKCCNMYIGSGLWNDENCNAVMQFVCKWPNDTSTTRVTPTPETRKGHCKKGWFEFQDYCYLPVGERESQTANWSAASSVCHDLGGYLASIHNEKEQAFLALLMQRLKNDTWIGLHDTIESESYYWTDNSDMQYTNWAPGEPSHYGYQEDCVTMVYDSIDSGIWKDELCSRKLPFVCQNDKDPSLELSYNRGMNCPHPESWLQLENSCFTMFPSNLLTWEAAELECQEHGAHLISVSDPAIRIVEKYLSVEANVSFWIGLRANSQNKISWINNVPLTITKWDKNEPANFNEDDSCFSSSSGGFWKKSSCSEQLPFICQITTGTRPAIKRRSGNCPSDKLWISGEGSYCYIFLTQQKLEWYQANFRCHSHGGSLASIHSIEEMEWVVKQFKPPESKYFYIGLTQNERGGFAWSDDSPVDFVNWDVGEPQNLNDSVNCVAVSAATLRWKISPCLVKRPLYLCSGLKDTIIYEDLPESALHTEGSGKGLAATVLAGTLVILIVVSAAVAASIFIYNRPLLRLRFRLLQRQQSTSFENALYNADSASMEFENERNDAFVT